MLVDVRDDFRLDRPHGHGVARVGENLAERGSPCSCTQDGDVCHVNLLADVLRRLIVVVAVVAAAAGARLLRADSVVLGFMVLAPAYARANAR